MAWSATAEVEEFGEAVEWFKDRFPATEALLAKLGPYAGQRAWTIAGVTQLDIVLQVHESIAAAIRDGTPLDEWKKDIGDKLTEAWGKKDSWRTELVFRNATQQSYVAGRLRQLREPDVLKLRPFWKFDGIGDLRQSPICKECDGVILPADDAWWETHTPLLHHACRSRIEALREKTAKEEGITPNPPDSKADPGFGKPPDLAGPFRPDKKDYPKELWTEYQKKHVPTEGVHFTKLVSNASNKRQREVLEAFTEKGVLPFLEQQPVGELRLNKSSGKRGANGWYRGGDKTELAVAAQRAPGSFGETFTPGKSWSISTSGTTAVEASKRTLIHEVGHHIHLTGDSEINDIVRKAFASKDANPITQYAGYNHKEYFSESFAAYKYHRAEFEEHDPVGFRMVQEVLRLRGVTL